MSKRYKWINGETYCDSDPRTLDEYLKDIAKIGVVEWDKFYPQFHIHFSGVCCDNFISLYEIWWNLNNLDDYLHEVEVVGNIWDNPEMVEKL